MVDLCGRLQGFGADDVACGRVVGLVGEAVVGDLLHGLRGDEETDGYVGEGGEFEVGGVADGEGSGWDGDGGASAEGECTGGGEVYFAAGGAERDGGGVDGEGIEAELVGEDDAGVRTAKRDVNDLSVGSVGGAEDAFGVWHGDWGGRPGADPVVRRCSGGILREAEEAEEREGQ